ncbi:UDP-N-acetylmuramoyl-L-alanine--D-glutamate ligase [Athalassotoga saccharophila]|uniref:UDP-N-acetylmuramoyl-L-alanine--D-glutamate ligase n=1 Tax=Athalassotoga saccharophila TaxID=1441386 RepID=UPI00137B2BE8|nr:UDP-N-acetylmuramoyl-L-alanine--D-glutamate ligase [Athalassotoga saccharophila]BBJ27542.1 UDP-N-acetylmuramoylalanine--D-glutamate ligase [Athalassotoga saccharophila]
MDFALIGFGVSNRSVLKFLMEKKMGNIFVSEKHTLSQEDKDFFLKHGIDFEENGNTERVLRSDLIIYSPSVRPDDPLIERAVKEKRAIGEIEFAWRYVLNGSKVVAITGSNGKTTTVSLTDHILKVSNIDHFTGGNIGTAASDRRNEPISLLEISSFQLMGTDTFVPDIGAVLNISPNHLDWHKNFEEYVDSKMKLAMAKTFIYNADSMIPKVNGIRVSRFSGDIIIDEKGFKIGKTYFSLSETKLRGIHNVYNAAFAAFIAKVLGSSEDEIMKGLETFIPLEHRQEVFARIDGVTYVNDSKSTTSESTLKALENFKNSIVIICGRPKEKDYSSLAKGLKERSKSVILMGEMVPIMEPLLDGMRYFKAKSMEEAVDISKRIAQDGDFVLLSPAATSFDMFKNYEERGKEFKRIVYGKINE